MADRILGMGDTINLVKKAQEHMDEVEAICDRVAIIDHGRILLAGSLAEILSCGVPEVRFRLERPLAQALHAQLHGRHGLRHEDHANNTYALPVSGLAELPRLLQQLAAADCAVLSMSYGSVNLEKVLMRLTHRPLRD